MADLVIVGGGPAGLATAIAGRLRGLDVVVLERRRPPIDKACGEGLMPSGVRLLTETLGVTPDPDGVHPFRGITYFSPDADETVVARADFPTGTGLGIRRVHLHQALWRRAEALGAELRPTQVTGLTEHGVTTDDGPVEGDVVVGADGLHSQVRRWAELEVPSPEPRRYGLRRHFALVPWSDHVEVHWGPDCEAYVTPAGPHRVGIAMLWGGGREAGADAFDALLSRFPALSVRLEGVPFDSEARGAGPLAQGVSGVVRDRVALVGDASGYLDAITGEGLSLAFHEAVALVDAAVARDLGAYTRAHASIVAGPTWLIRRVLTLQRHPALRRRAMRVLAANPDLFQRILAVNDGELAPQQFGLRNLARLGLSAARV